MGHIFGTAGDDSLGGTSAGDTFWLDDGGADTASGGQGFDRFMMGACFDATDRLDGGSEDDSLYLDGDYAAKVTIGPQTLVSIEYVEMTGRHDYWLVFDAADTPPIIDASRLTRGDRATIDVSADKSADGGVSYSSGAGRDSFFGSSGDDSFYALSVGPSGADKVKLGAGADTLFMGDSFDARDRVNGGAGNFDQLFMTTTSASGGLLISKAMMRGVESMTLESGGETGFALTLEDGVVKADHRLFVYGNDLGSTALDFDGSAETNGRYYVTGDAGDDTLAGGRLDDLLDGRSGVDLTTGGHGADTMYGGDGDQFIYREIADSLVATPDQIFTLGGADVIDLSAIDARLAQAGDQAFVLVAGFTGHAGEATLSVAQHETSLMLDQTGDGVADFLVVINGDHADFAGFVW